MQAADKWGKRHPVTDTFDLRVQDALRDAATALSTLQTENKKLRADFVRLNDLLASYQNVLVPELRSELKQVTLENNALWTYIEIVDREYRRYMDRGYVDRLDELKRTWKCGQKED
jgi:hypothetical protein